MHDWVCSFRNTHIWSMHVWKCTIWFLFVNPVTFIKLVIRLLCVLCTCTCMPHCVETRTCLALVLSHHHLQFSIICSMQLWSGKVWEIWIHAPSGRRSTLCQPDVMYVAKSPRSSTFAFVYCKELEFEGVKSWKWGLTTCGTLVLAVFPLLSRRNSCYL